MKKSLLATMKTELQKAQQIHSQSSQQYPLYDLDLGKFSEKVMQLTDRWQKIDKQIDFRCVSLLAQGLPAGRFKCHQKPLLSKSSAFAWADYFLSPVLTMLDILYKCTHTVCRLL